MAGSISLALVSVSFRGIDPPVSDAEKIPPFGSSGGRGSKNLKDAVMQARCINHYRSVHYHNYG
jgi:hypothetical protein